MSRDEVKLLPCPWCDGRALAAKGRQIECVNCGAEGPSRFTDSREDAWNTRRTPDPRAVELLQLLRDELRAITLADKTTYEHHEPRKCDGALPRIEGGTCWRTPRQLSERAISKIDAFLTAHPAPAQNEGGERG